MIRNFDNIRISKRGRTSICKSSVMNLGNNPRVLGMEENVGGFGLPRVCTARSFVPSHSMALRVAMKCIPLQRRELMKHRFQETMKKGRFFISLLQWMRCFQAMGCATTFWNSFLWTSSSTVELCPPRNNNVAKPDRDSVVMVQAYGDGDLVDDMDFKYRTFVAFLPGAGVFYCAREGRRLEVGCNKVHMQLDASWFWF
jgi:hypothetical protein